MASEAPTYSLQQLFAAIEFLHEQQSGPAVTKCIEIVLANMSKNYSDNITIIMELTAQKNKFPKACALILEHIDKNIVVAAPVAAVVPIVASAPVVAVVPISAAPIVASAPVVTRAKVLVRPTFANIAATASHITETASASPRSSTNSSTASARSNDSKKSNGKYYCTFGGCTANFFLIEKQLDEFCGGNQKRVRCSEHRFEIVKCATCEKHTKIETGMFHQYIESGNTKPMYCSACWAEYNSRSNHW